jgi:hypothetical protein
MKQQLLTMTFGLGLLALAAQQTNAQTMPRNCGPRDAIVSSLAEKYNETRQSIGIAANNAVMELFASEESGSWTITVTLPNGMTCLVASGQAFEELAEALPPKGNDA